MTLTQGDCHDILPALADKSVDLILCDPPFGLFSEHQRDQPLRWDKIWPELWRITKPQRGILLFAAQPFTSQLIVSNLKDFRYLWYWECSRPASPFHRDKMPAKVVTEICVFGRKCPYYAPPKVLLPKPRHDKAGGFWHNLYNVSGNRQEKQVSFGGARNTVYVPNGRDKFPFQKPVKLLEFFVKIYSCEGDTVLDFCMGTGATGIACMMTGRHFVGIEKDEATFARAKERIERIKVWRFQ